MSRHRAVRNLSYDDYDDYGDDDYDDYYEDEDLDPEAAAYQYTGSSAAEDISHVVGAAFDDETAQPAPLVEQVAPPPGLGLPPGLSAPPGLGAPSQESEEARKALEAVRLVEEKELDEGVAAMRAVLGDTHDEAALRSVLRRFNRNANRALDSLLGGAPAATPAATSVQASVPPRQEAAKRQSSNKASASNAATTQPTPKTRSAAVGDSLSDNAKPESETAPVNDDSEDEGQEEDDDDDDGGHADVRQARPQLSKAKVHTRKRKVTIDIATEAAKLGAAQGKERLNLVIIGHVDAGKSTLMGHLLHLCGHVAQRDLHKYKKESSRMGKGSFAFAWVLDSTPEEREHGVTMDVAHSAFETPNRAVTVLDAPGHRDFIPNMITGAAQADVALLVVDASMGGFESGFDRGGQTREHALLARSLGVTQMVVAVNKMDGADWSEGRFDEIAYRMEEFLVIAGFKRKAIYIVPCSGLLGKNLTEPCSELDAWYQGETLITAIDKLRPNSKNLDAPMRFSVADVFKPMTSGICLAGKVVTGWLQEGDPIVLLPNHEEAVIKAITVDDAPRKIALAGETPVLTVTGCDADLVHTGDIACHDETVLKMAVRVRCQIIVFEPAVPLTKGADLLVHYQQHNEPAILRKLIALVDKGTSEVVKKHPRHLPAKSSAIVDIVFDRPVCLEPFGLVKDLGRVMLRHQGHTVATGIVLEVKESV